ncbi:MAG: protease modulator HflC [Candidatus Sumerlaeia bacterium]|nr:protease modulator HflC [Candidatus Sumerlaeia bacterium]
MTVSTSTLKKLAGTAVILVAVAITVFSSAYRINEAQQGIILQFGEPIGDVISEAGLHWKRPFIQEVRKFDKRMQAWDGDVNQIPTLGREFIIVDTTARWRIVDPLLFLKSVRDEAGAKSRLNDIIDSVVRDKVSGTDLEEIVRSRDWKYDPSDQLEEELDRTDIDLEAAPTKGREELTREILTEASAVVVDYGIELIDVRIKRLNYIDDVRVSVEQRMISERERIAERFRSEGQGRSAEIDGQTDREVREIISRAEREAEEIRGRADAEATQIYGQAFGADPEFYGFFKTLESYRKSITGNTTIMTRADSDFFRYLDTVDHPDINID